MGMTVKKVDSVCLGEASKNKKPTSSYFPVVSRGIDRFMESVHSIAFITTKKMLK